MVLAVLSISTPLFAQGLMLPLQIDQEKTPYNLQSTNGVPLSSDIGNPPGSDGRVPIGPISPTPHQFSSMISYGGLVSSEGSRVAPSAVSGETVRMKIQRAQVGAPFLNRRSSFSFGAIIPPPAADYQGEILPEVSDIDYWESEPYSTNGHLEASYYWSPHAGRVYATQPGPIFITWKKTVPFPVGQEPSEYVNDIGAPLGVSSFVTDGANVFLLKTEQYVISGSAAKTPRLMFWTEEGFQDIGKRVEIPGVRVSEVNIVYNNTTFPATVEEPYVGAIGDSNPTDGTGLDELPVLRTFWYDDTDNTLHAYNIEGRVFVELLGDLRADNVTYEQIGFEIVDVIKQPIPNDLSAALGERIHPPGPGTITDLFPEPLLQNAGDSFDYQHSIEGSEFLQLYAARETQNLNDYLVYWMEKGVAEIKWPRNLARYDLHWPDDLNQYSHYVRPAVTSDAEAQLTSVSLDPGNVPVIEYQDSLDRPRAFISADSRFYTWLDETQPAHRTLLRYGSGEQVAFERVLSLWDGVIKDTDNITGTFLEEDPHITAYLAYPGLQENYLQDLDAYQIEYSNYLESLLLQFTGEWKLFLGDDYPSADDGSLKGWRLRFRVKNLETGERRWIERENTDEIFIGANSSPSPSTIVISEDDVLPNTVVLELRVEFVGLSHGFSQDIDAFLMSPKGKVCALMSDAGGGSPGISNVNLRFRDTANSKIPQNSKPINGKNYQPTNYAGDQNEIPPGVIGSIQDTLSELLDEPLPAPEPPTPPEVVLRPWPEEDLTSPRIVQETVIIGDRIEAPSLELGAGSEQEYWAGYINPEVGTLYDINAYLDPYLVGFEAANEGAIIPINAMPDQNQLEVWWFRSNRSHAGVNAGDASKGFSPVHWPSVIGQYTLQWPEHPKEIVLASKRGGEDLSSLEAKGSIYFQNDPEQDGYNPNEEHAIMFAGTPYATRDDLNATLAQNTHLSYSSEPYVLVAYTESDGRPDITPFKVLREKPEDGYVFDYIVSAGQLLQPPPPLTFFPKPIEGSGDTAVNYNTEPQSQDGDLPINWDEESHISSYGHYKGFTYRDRKEDIWVYRGPHAGRPKLEVGTYNAETDTFTDLTGATAIVDAPFSFTIHASRQEQYLTLNIEDKPAWLTIDGLTISGEPQNGDVGTSNLILEVNDFDGSAVSSTLTLTVQDRSSGPAQSQSPLTLTSTNPYTGSTIDLTGRPPFLGVSPDPSNSFTMQYYYKTLPGFAWPGMDAESIPPGSIVPYLRPADGQGFIGDPESKTTEALDIVYRPVWPVLDPKDSSMLLPEIPFGYTLTEPAIGLPGIRDWKTAHVLYEQSIAGDMETKEASAVLHDPTVFKLSDLAEHDLMELPGGVKTELFKGKIYFPNLTPHLEKRLFVDPNRGEAGSLVLQGEYKEEVLGSNYLHLNILRGEDLTAVHELCPQDDPDYNKWTAAIDGLAVNVQTYYEDPKQPGTYIAFSSTTDIDDIEATYLENYENALKQEFSDALGTEGLIAEWIETELNAKSIPRAREEIRELTDSLFSEAIGVGDMVEIKSDNVPRDSYALSATGPGSGYVTLLENSGTAFTEPGDPVAMHVFRVGSPELYPGELKIIAAENPLSELVTFQHSADLAGRTNEFEYEWKIAAPVDGFPPEENETMSAYLPLVQGEDLPRFVLGGSGIQVLGDNYVTMRYRAKNPSHPLYDEWSPWSDPALAEGWIKRVLAGINPFTQRITDLFNNSVNTDVSILTQAGPRWEGDVALNLEVMNDYGLIEIYETVLRRGRLLSIEDGYNYGPANDALLLAAGYLNDLYMILGNEAWADAANPTIGIGTADNTYEDIATALFSFKGQLPSLLEEELALLRGRDDVFQPGVQIAPLYNRLIWNYTRGIDGGEVVYALNYNIQENPDFEPDGVIDASDAAHMFPQGHGDAYGHYLTALKGYYSLLINPNFDWVPRIEAVNILGVPVSVDYQDERKFAAAAAAVARAGKQIFDLTWRKDHKKVARYGWEHLSDSNDSDRHWGLDQWASRVGQGSYINWIVGNSMLPPIDPDPTHEGIQKVDRTTVPELRELPVLAASLQTGMDHAEGGLSPLGIGENAVALDLNPEKISDPNSYEEQTHFEQIYLRAKGALNNAVTAFDDAKDVTRLMRSEEDSLAELQNDIANQELAYRNALIEIYGTPYPDDMGPGKTWNQDFDGPDTIHYMYVETPELDYASLWNYPGEIVETEWEISLADLPPDWGERYDHTATEIYNHPNYSENPTIKFSVGPHGYFEKPSDWTSRRASPGKIQQAISAEIAAHNSLLQAVYTQTATKASLDRLLGVFLAEVNDYGKIRSWERDLLEAEETLSQAKLANELFELAWSFYKSYLDKYNDAIIEALPNSFIAGLAAGGDLTAGARSVLKNSNVVLLSAGDGQLLARTSLLQALETATETTKRWREFEDIARVDRSIENRAALVEIGNFFEGMQDQLWGINQSLRELDDAEREVQGLLAEGNRILEEREIFRKRSSALIHGYRTRDTAFRIFRNEKLERYKTLFDLASQYAWLAANAYDYETGLLGTDAGQSFLQRIIQARALGVVGEDGEPQFAGSNTGDPGLSSALAEMKGDWDVVRSRLGFNNPDNYTTLASLRTEHFRILPTTSGDMNWEQVLNEARKRDLLEDADVRRNCMQIANDDGTPVPGIILEFSTTITDGFNLFGRPLAAYDHAYSPSSFATKIHSIGVALEGYMGMEDPDFNEDAGGQSPSDPDISFLDPTALSATPYIYLVPVGADIMRSPPLGDANELRSWVVKDVAIPMPFNVGAAELSTSDLYQSNDYLTEPLFSIRKHQAFRPVSDASLLDVQLEPSIYVNTRLIGRSVWNTKWKLIIPGKTLLGDPDEGLDRLIRTLKDIKLYFVTYSYSGN